MDRRQFFTISAATAALTAGAGVGVAQTEGCPPVYNANGLTTCSKRLALIHILFKDKTLRTLYETPLGELLSGDDFEVALTAARNAGIITDNQREAIVEAGQHIAAITTANPQYSAKYLLSGDRSGDADYQQLIDESNTLFLNNLTLPFVGQPNAMKSTTGAFLDDAAAPEESLLPVLGSWTVDKLFREPLRTGEQRSSEQKRHFNIVTRAKSSYAFGPHATNILASELPEAQAESGSEEKGQGWVCDLTLAGYPNGLCLEATMDLYCTMENNECTSISDTRPPN